MAVNSGMSSLSKTAVRSGTTGAGCTGGGGLGRAGSGAGSIVAAEGAGSTGTGFASGMLRVIEEQPARIQANANGASTAYLWPQDLTANGMFIAAWQKS